MAVFEWARGPQHFSNGSELDPYYLGVMEARDFHGPDIDLNAEDIVTSALFPYVTLYSHERFDWRTFDPTRASTYTGAPYEDEQTSAYAKSLDVMTEEVAGYQNLPAFMGSVLLR